MSSVPSQAGQQVRSERFEPVISDEAYRHAVELGRAAVASHLGTLLEEEGRLEGAEAAYRGADQYDDATTLADVGLLAEQRGEVSGVEAAYSRTEAAHATPLVAVAIPQAADADSEGDRGRAYTRNAAGGFRRPGFLLGVGMIIAIAIAAVAEVAASKQSNPPSRRATAPSVKTPASAPPRRVLHRSASPSKPKLAAARKANATTSAAGPRSRTTAIAVTRATAPASNDTALSATAQSATGTGGNPGINGPNGRPGSTYPTSSAVGSPSTGTGNSRIAPGSPDTGGGGPTRRSAPPGGGSGSSGGHGTYPTDTSTGTRPSGGGTTGEGGITSSGGG